MSNQTDSDKFEVPLTSEFELASFRSQERKWTLALKDPHKSSAPLTTNFKFGWMLAYLIDVESRIWGRWAHYFRVLEAGKVIENEKIPQIEWESPTSAGYSLTMKLLRKCFEEIPEYPIQSQIHSEATWLYFLQWILFGLGYPDQKSLPREPFDGAHKRLSEAFRPEIALVTMILFPYDYFGDLLAERDTGKKDVGFCPTPLDLVSLTVSLSLQLSDAKDLRAKTIGDCCCGTGRLLLEASNHSYRLFGQELNRINYLSCIINHALYAPWGYRGFSFFRKPMPSGTMIHNAEIIPFKGPLQLVLLDDLQVQSV